MASPDIDRVLALPRRPVVDLDGSVTAEALVYMMTTELALPPRQCRCRELGYPCALTLRPAQAWALYEARRRGGLLAPIGVGHGKTLINFLVTLVIEGCRLAVLLIPPEHREQTKAAYTRWREHFRVPSIRMGEWGHIVPGMPVVQVIPYSVFSRPESTRALEKLEPDLVIADEAHRLRSRDTARTGRLLRYFADHPQTRLCCWSGSFLKNSIRNFAHLSAVALRDGSPLPVDPEEVERWAAAVDPNDRDVPAGALARLIGPGQDLYTALHLRLVQTEGVVSTKSSACDATLNIFEREAPVIPDSLAAVLREFRVTNVRPDDEWLNDALEISRCARQLACGFYYRWKFPRGEPPELIERWREARKCWAREVRAKMREHAPFLDSPNLLEQAASRFFRALDPTDEAPCWNSYSYREWHDVCDLVQPQPDAVWLDDYLAADCAAWAGEHRGIIWCQHTVFARRVAKLAGIPLHLGGATAEQRILAERGQTAIVASLKSHGTGRDGLQLHFTEQIFPNPPESNDAWEQPLGRLHRPGQTSDEVTAYVYRHTGELCEAFDKALMQARWTRAVIGADQKLLLANLDFEVSPDR